jgi:hypothetical protein
MAEKKPDEKTPGEQLKEWCQMAVGGVFLIVLILGVIEVASWFGGDDEKPEERAAKSEQVEKPAKPKPKPKPAKFTGTSKSARIVTRQVYGAGPDGKTDEGVQLVRSATCTKYMCTIAMRPETPVFDAERETLEDARPLFKRLFRLKTLESATLEIYGKTTSVGGKEGVSQIAEFTCTRRAHNEIDWDRVDEDGLKALCAWVPLVKF